MYTYCETQQWRSDYLGLFSHRTWTSRHWISHKLLCRANIPESNLILASAWSKLGPNTAAGLHQNNWKWPSQSPDHKLKGLGEEKCLQTSKNGSSIGCKFLHTDRNGSRSSLVSWFKWRHETSPWFLNPTSFLQVIFSQSFYLYLLSSCLSCLMFAAFEKANTRADWFAAVVCETKQTENDSWSRESKLWCFQDILTWRNDLKHRCHPCRACARWFMWCLDSEGPWKVPCGIRYHVSRSVNSCQFELESLWIRLVPARLSPPA